MSQPSFEAPSAPACVGTPGFPRPPRPRAFPLSGFPRPREPARERPPIHNLDARSTCGALFGLSFGARHQDASSITGAGHQSWPCGSRHRDVSSMRGYYAHHQSLQAYQCCPVGLGIPIEGTGLGGRGTGMPKPLPVPLYSAAFPRRWARVARMWGACMGELLANVADRGWLACGGVCM